MLDANTKETATQGSWGAEPHQPFWHDRRDFIRHALMAIGVAGASLNDSTMALAAKAKKTSKKNFLSPARFALLDAASETIMPRTDTPGARDVLVAKRMDALLKNWASPKSQTDFIRVLDEIDVAARAQNKKGFAALKAPQQLEVMTVFDKQKMADKGYARFKNLVFALYYLSEVGATKELRYEHVPGAWEPSIPVTSDTRGYAVDVSFGGN